MKKKTTNPQQNTGIVSGTNAKKFPLTLEEHGVVGVGREKSYKDDQRAQTPLVWGQAERDIQPGESKALGLPYSCLQGLEGGLQKSWGVNVLNTEVEHACLKYLTLHMNKCLNFQDSIYLWSWQLSFI